MRGYGWITPLKVGRKLWYLRHQGKPNHEDGATARTWQVFCKILIDLGLTTKLKRYY